jgi:hypothetical protein
MSLSELANLDVTSVSKSSEPMQRAPATIYVITHEDILRSGVTSVPEALRLAPNLLITQTSSSAYTISARGLGGNPAAQNFSNKLLILIDGRSVYTPLFSGIYSDTLDVMLEDIDRIERGRDAGVHLSSRRLRYLGQGGGVSRDILSGHVAQHGSYPARCSGWLCCSTICSTCPASPAEGWI